MRYIFQYPETSGSATDMLDAGPVADVARAAEAAGFAAFSFTEHPAPGARWLESGGHQTLDPFAALAHVAAVTTQMRLLPYLAVAPYRNPLLLAKAAITIDRLSNGRFTLGIGTGYQKTEFFSLGVDFEERNALFDEALEVWPLCWSGKPFSFEGRHFSARDIILLPAPAQNPIPVWIGGNSQLTMRRVAERAQGWMAMNTIPDISATTRTPHIEGNDDLAARIRQLREMAGDRAASIEISASYSDPSFTDPAKDVARHRDGLAALEAIGVDWCVISVAPESLDRSRAFIDAFAHHYTSG
jgi:probable F420-dependent oxidoreductase